MLQAHKDLTPSIAAVIDHGREATGGTHHATSAQGPHSFHRGSHRPWKRSDWRHSSCYKYTRTSLLPSRQSSTMEEKRLEALLMLQVHKDLTPSIVAVIDHGREATGGTHHATSTQGPHSFHRGSHRPRKRSDWRHSSCYKCTRTSLSSICGSHRQIRFCTQIEICVVVDHCTILACQCHHVSHVLCSCYQYSGYGYVCCPTCLGLYRKEGRKSLFWQVYKMKYSTILSALETITKTGQVFSSVPPSPTRTTLLVSLPPCTPSLSL